MKRCKRLFIVILSFLGIVSSFSQIQNGKYVFQNETVVTAYSTHIFMEIDLADARAVTTVLLQELVNEWAHNLTCQVDFYENIDDLKKDILDNKIDFVVLTTPEYFMLRNQVNITPFLTYNVGGQVLHSMLLISRKDSNFRSVLELKRKRIAAFSALNDELNLPSLWFTTLVLKNGQNYDDEYASWVYKVRKGPNAISDVFFRKADAALVPEMAFNISKELNPQIGVQLCVIDSSKYMLYSVLCYTERMTEEINKYEDRNYQTVIDLMCSTSTTETGKRFLSVFRIVSFVPFKSEYLKDTETLFNDFKALTLDTKRRVK